MAARAQICGQSPGLLRFWEPAAALATAPEGAAMKFYVPGNPASGGVRSGFPSGRLTAQRAVRLPIGS